MENGSSSGVNKRKISGEEVLTKLKDDGDFDKLRVKIIRRLKDDVSLFEFKFYWINFLLKDLSFSVLSFFFFQFHVFRLVLVFREAIWNMKVTVSKGKV